VLLQMAYAKLTRCWRSNFGAYYTFLRKENNHFRRVQRSRNPFYIKSIMLRKHWSVTQHGWAKKNRKHVDAPLFNDSQHPIPFRLDYLPRDRKRRRIERNDHPLVFVEQNWHVWLAKRTFHHSHIYTDDRT